MGKQKKINPRRIPRTQADVNRVGDDAVKLTLIIVMSVLADKYSFDKNLLRNVLDDVVKLSNEVRERRVSKQDLLTVLLEEYEINLK